jgi:FlaA1/EpsC-like NDP-sugar epimerase
LAQYENEDTNEVAKKRASDVRKRQESLKAEAEKPNSEMVRTSDEGNAERVLVTGGLGFIGSHVVEELLKRGLRVVIFDDESNGHNHNKLAKEIRGDVSVVDDLSKVHFQRVFPGSLTATRSLHANHCRSVSYALALDFCNRS